MSSAKTSLSNNCNRCAQRKNLSCCTACKVVYYCSRDHQVADRPAHKSVCNAVVKTRQTFEAEETRLRELPGDWMTPSNPLENSVGYFWGILETRDYMRARYALADALGEANTRTGVAAQLAHFMDMFRLCRGDNMGVRFAVPALMIRLGKDQECYDFVKWWAVVSHDTEYDSGDMSLPYMNLRGEDAFEGVERFCGEYVELDYVVAVTLLKIRMLLDLQSLQAVARETDGKVPNEIRASIRSYATISDIVGGNREILDAQDHSARIDMLVSQVRALVVQVIKSNPWFWHMLLDHEEIDLPSSYSRGSPEEAQIAMHYSVKAWRETNGAIDLVKELLLLSETHGKAKVYVM